MANIADFLSGFGEAASSGMTQYMQTQAFLQSLEAQKQQMELEKERQKLADQQHKREQEQWEIEKAKGNAALWQGLIEATQDPSVGREQVEQFKAGKPMTKKAPKKGYTRIPPASGIPLAVSKDEARRAKGTSPPEKQPTPETTTQTVTEMEDHVVKKGETPSVLASQYKMDEAELIRINKDELDTFTDSETKEKTKGFTVGDVIQIPVQKEVPVVAPTAPQTFKGDSLYATREYKYTTEEEIPFKMPAGEMGMTPQMINNLSDQLPNVDTKVIADMSQVMPPNEVYDQARKMQSEMTSIYGKGKVDKATPTYKIVQDTVKDAYSFAKAELQQTLQLASWSDEHLIKYRDEINIAFMKHLRLLQYSFAGTANLDDPSAKAVIRDLDNRTQVGKLIRELDSLEDSISTSTGLEKAKLEGRQGTVYGLLQGYGIDPWYNQDQYIKFAMFLTDKELTR